MKFGHNTLEVFRGFPNPSACRIWLGTMTKTILMCFFGSGWGHLVRGLSLAKVAVRNGYTVHLLVNSPYTRYIPAIAGITLHSLQPKDSSLLPMLASPHDYFVVDTFPAGYQGCLKKWIPDVKSPKIFIHRSIAREKVIQFQQQVQDWYDLVIIPGEITNLSFAHLPQTRYTEPWLICSAEEIQHPNVAKAKLNLKLDSPTIALLVSGNPQERSHWAQVAQRIVQEFPNAQFRYFATEPLPGCADLVWVRLFPAMPWLLAADVVVGSGGYNTINECRSLGVPLIALSLERLFDRQSDRIEIHQSERLMMSTHERLCNAIALMLDRKHSVQFPPRYSNGAEEAFQLISALKQKDHEL
jgi:hypothetical protein